MQAKLTSDFFAGNRRALRELFTGTAPIVMTANGLLQRGGDSTYKFAQDASFWYLTGIDDPDIVLVMDRDREYLIVPARSTTRAAFDGEVETNEIQTVSGIDLVLNDSDGWAQLEARLKKVKHVATLSAAPTYVEQYGMYTNPARAALTARLQAINPEAEILDLATHLARMRMIKQPAEIAAIQQAIDVTSASMKAILKPAKLSAYQHEYEVEAELTRAYRRAGTSGHSFEPIVASGERACTLHNVSNSGNIKHSQLLLIDTGAEVSHYAADITRTLAVGKPSRRQQAIYDAVLEVQEFAFGLLGPGVLLRDYEQQIEHFMGEKLRELGLIKTINHENVRKFYPHATSHFMGLNVHDVGDYDRPLEPGVVLTVEPGIYSHKEGIGVRIEDDVLITAKGIKILSNQLARDLTKL